jgi:hypothetical protein
MPPRWFVPRVTYWSCGFVLSQSLSASPAGGNIERNSVPDPLPLPLLLPLLLVEAKPDTTVVMAVVVWYSIVLCFIASEAGWSSRQLVGSLKKLKLKAGLSRGLVAGC